MLLSHLGPADLGTRAEPRDIHCFTDRESSSALPCPVDRLTPLSAPPAGPLLAPAEHTSMSCDNISSARTSSPLLLEPSKPGRPITCAQWFTHSHGFVFIHSMPTDHLVRT